KTKYRLATAASATRTRSDRCLQPRLQVCAEAFSFCDADLSTNAAAFNVTLVHRLGEHGRHDELTSIARFDLIIDLKRVRGRGHEKHPAIFADIDIIDPAD